MIKKIMFCFLLVVTVILPTTVNANTKGIVNGSGVRIRSLPNTNGSVLAEVYPGDNVDVIDRTKITGEGCNEGWYKILHNNSDAYICSSFVNLVGYNTSDWTARTNSNFINVRSGPSTANPTVDSLILGTNLTILDYNASGGGCADSWLRIKYFNKKEGYICSTFVNFKEDITDTDEEYAAVLRGIGFTDDYIPYLTHLHKKYPNWVFVPVLTNLNWDDVMNGESGKNYIQSTKDFYISRSDLAENPNWYYANNGVISFYMDPRNFLNERYIFMFEKLNFDNRLEASYPGTVKNVFTGGSFSTDEFANILTTAGKNNGVSPLHLASRIKQEVGINGNNATDGSEFTWNGTKYSNFYNFFNIEAYGDNPRLRGLAYAAGLFGGNYYGRPWDTVEKSISGGAKFLGGSYITKGQYTLYFQKFNTSPTAQYPKYTHQYMTNIHAPSGEASSTYDSYGLSKLLQDPFVFEIPIYLNMPESTSLPISGNSNNYLSNIKINGVNITDFDKDVIEYTYYISNTLNEITLEAFPEDTLSNILGTGTISIPNDQNTIHIMVTAENGDKKTYTINIIKVEEIKNIDEIMRKIPYSVKETYISNLKLGTAAKTIINSILSNSPASTVVIKNSSGKIINGSDIIKTGYSITVTSTSNETKTFKMSVIGDLDGDGEINILDLLKLQKHILGTNPVSDIFAVSADNNNDGTVTILDLLRLQKHILKEIVL